jgi:Transposase IS116/IS110/IS902 family
MNDTTQLSPITILSRDLKRAAVTLTDKEARFLVDGYYMMQDQRIRAGNQIRSMDKAEKPEPHDILSWFSDQATDLENSVKGALDVYAKNHAMGPWLYAVKGIGPVIAAGLVAHIEINKAPTVGHIWRYAGLDPTSKWEKGKKRPWNASLKVLCWKIGESFVRVSGYEDAYYGQLYKERKAREIAKNEAGDFADQAADILTKKNIRKETDAYKAYSIGKLPPDHVHSRAKRYAVKQFLADLHGEMYRTILKQEPPLPYPITILGHDPRHLRKGP